MADKNVRTEEFRVQGEQIAQKVKELVRQGNIRRISIQDSAGQDNHGPPSDAGRRRRADLAPSGCFRRDLILASHYRIAVEKAPEEI